MQVSNKSMPMMGLSIETKRLLQTKNLNRMALKGIEEDIKLKSSQNYRKQAIITPYEINITV